MFERYRAYHAYRRAVFEWATRHDYQRSDIQFVYPWDTRETPTASIIVLLQPEKLLDDEQYHHIYQSQNVHIYERKTDDLQPAVRHGIPSQLQTALLAQARSVIELEVQGSTDVEIGAYEAYRTLAEEDCYVDVTVWVDGMTRGSYVMHDTLMGAVVAAAKRAGKDSRYKPLTPKELATMRVEVVVVVDLWLPLTILDAALPVNIATRLMQRGETKAWFVPTVPNVVRYEHLGEYLNRLLTKAGSALVPDIAHGFTYAPCFSFVESHSNGTPIELCGVVPRETNNQFLSKETAQSIAAHLVCSIDEDGYTQNIFSLERPYNRQLDIVRLAFLEYTLSEYAYLSDDDTHEPARQRLQLFLETSNATKRSIGRAIYGSQSDCWQGQQNSLNRTLVETVNYQTLRAVNAETLMYVQILKAHYCLGILRDSRGKNRLAAVQNIYQHWHQHQDDADPIAYADLVPLLATHELTEEVAVFIDWLQSNLHRDYTNATLFGIRTTRGVGKIAEALASTEAGHDLARQALSWLSRMQYTNESMFHIPISVQDRFQHGFRHSYWDRDLWLDGSCHALLAICRILYFDRYTKHQQMCSLPHAD